MIKPDKNILRLYQGFGASRTRKRACPLIQWAMKGSFLRKYARFRRVNLACEKSGVSWHHICAWLRWDRIFRRRFIATQRVVRRDLKVLRAFRRATHKSQHGGSLGVICLELGDGSSATFLSGRLVIRLSHGRRQPYRAMRAVDIAMARWRGAKIAELAHQYGLSQTRIRQIVQKVDGKKSALDATG